MIVGSQLSLDKALTKLSVVGGEIKLLPGNYYIDRWKIGPEKGLITLSPLYPEDPPVFSRIELKRSRNICIDGIKFRGGEASHDFRVIDGCESITLKNSDCLGTASSWVKQGSKIPNSFSLVSDSYNVSVENCKIRRYWQGISFLRCSKCQFKRNSVKLMAADGLRMSDVHGMLVSDNLFARFLGSDQRLNHSDMIQVWALPNVSTNVAIVNNSLDSQSEKGGVATQSILVLNERFEKSNEKHKGFFIASNRIRNGHVNGIVLEHAEYSQVMANTISWDKEAFMFYESGPENSQPKVRVI